MYFIQHAFLLSCLIINISIYAQQPSSYDFELQQEGILDSEFRYTDSPKTFQLYRSSTAMLNKATPMEIGDGVQMISAIQMPSLAAYTYSVPVDSRNLTKEQINDVKEQYYSQFESIFCFSVNKNIHYRVNNRREKFIYLDKNGSMFMDVDIQASDCK